MIHVERTVRQDNSIASTGKSNRQISGESTSLPQYVSISMMKVRNQPKLRRVGKEYTIGNVWNDASFAFSVEF